MFRKLIDPSDCPSLLRIQENYYPREIGRGCSKKGKVSDLGPSTMILDPENFSPWLKTGSKVGETVDPSESRRNAKFRTEVLTEIRYNSISLIAY